MNGLNRKSYMMCLSKSMNAIAEFVIRENKDPSKSQFYLYLDPQPIGVLNRWCTMVVKVDCDTQTVIPVIVTAPNVETIRQNLRALENDMSSKVIKANNDTVWGNILTDYSMMCADRITNYIPDTKKVTPCTVLAQIVRDNLSVLLSYAKHVKWNRNVLSYGFKDLGNGMTQDGPKYEFNNGVNIILTRPVIQNNKIVDVIFEIELSLEILRANKNDKLF